MAWRTVGSRQRFDSVDWMAGTAYIGQWRDKMARRGLVQGTPTPNSQEKQEAQQMLR